MGERFALIAGGGEIPAILARAAKDKGASFVAVSLTEAAIAPLEGLAECVHSLSIGQVGKIIRTIKKAGINKVVFIGKVRKDLLFEKIRFDLRAVKLLSSLKNRNDDTIMLALVRAFYDEGIEVLDQTAYLRDLMPAEGVLTKRKPSKKEWLDIRYGMVMAKRSASLDIGQTVIVKDQAIMAVEAIEGTDEAIKRGGLLSKKGGAVVAKVAKPDQDPRFDVPTVGKKTLESMREAGITVLAIEAEKTLFVNMDEVIRDADVSGISIVSYKLEEY
ncbi:MAG: UDP-2,3-diacylglucosamine diphosphatase LpxI [Deltaproteobacteria bacterium]|nr:UDP-2,3-diacylglucosamine diphosphatase LpxI [Deltaproteobacteria bacterium]